MNGFRIAEAALVFGERRRIEEAQTLLGLRELLLDEPVRVRTHHALGQIVGLNVEEPVPGEHAPLPADVIEQVMLRNDVEDCRARDFLRVVEAHAMQDTRAAVVACGIKLVEAERRHHLDLILRHCAERVAGMILAAGRLFGIAVTAQVGAHDGEIARQRRRNFVPGQMIEGIAVHQQQRRS